MSNVVDAPHRSDRELEHSLQRQPERNGEPGAQVTFAVAASDAIHRQHHHVNASAFRALHHGAVEATIFVEIKLVNLRSFEFLT
jgi:hypothetical protein